MPSSVKFTNGFLDQVDINTDKEESLAIELANHWLNKGVNFSEAIAAAAALLTGCRWAAVSRVTPGSPLVEILALYDNGVLTDCFTYDFRTTPCEQVLGQEKFQLYRNVQQAFPLDADLVAMGVADYAGYAFKSRLGVIAGHLFVMHDQSITRFEVVETVLTSMVSLLKLEWPDDLSISD